MEREITVAAEADDVWRALTEEELLTEWLAFSWGGSRVELTVDAVSDGTRVRVVETAPVRVGEWGPRLTALASASTLALA